MVGEYNGASYFVDTPGKINRSPLKIGEPAAASGYGDKERFCISANVHYELGITGWKVVPKESDRQTG